MGARVRTPHRGRASARVALAALALALALPIWSGCGEGPGGDSPGAFSAEPVEGGFRGISYDEYESGVADIVTLLDEYWAETLPAELDAEYSPPSDVIPYRPGDGPLPSCAGEKAPSGNAYYCGADDTIAWDETGLMIPFYAEVGDAAVGFVIAHEFGHLVQARLGAGFPLTIEQELNADCLAGSFAGALSEQGLLEGGEGLEPGTDLREAAEGIYDFGDAPGVPWQDPDAHGQPKQRLRAFAIGYDGGVRACARKLAPGFSESA